MLNTQGRIVRSNPVPGSYLAQDEAKANTNPETRLKKVEEELADLRKLLEAHGIR